MQLPKYELDQEVLVQVFNIITTGTIIKQEIHITCHGTQIKYWVDFGKDTVTPWESDLNLVQGLPLGKMK